MVPRPAAIWTEKSAAIFLSGIGFVMVGVKSFRLERTSTIRRAQTQSVALAHPAIKAWRHSWRCQRFAMIAMNIWNDFRSPIGVSLNILATLRRLMRHHQMRRIRAFGYRSQTGYPCLKLCPWDSQPFLPFLSSITQPDRKRSVPFGREQGLEPVSKSW